MARIREFNLLSYSDLSSRSLETKIAPPYDVISPSFREILKHRSPYNCVHLILGDPDPKGSSSDTSIRYTMVGKKFAQWLESGTLKYYGPSMLVIEDTFSWEGTNLQRRGLLCCIEITEFGKGSVYPHEKTNRAPIEDRLAILQDVHAHLSPVYMVSDDPRGEIGKLLSKVQSTVPTASFKNLDENLSHRLWRIQEPLILEKIKSLFEKQSLVIADGHHRYTTALEGAKRFGSTFPESKWMMVYISLTSDPGVVLSSIHRRVSTNISLETICQHLKEFGSIKKVSANWSSFLKDDCSFSVLRNGFEYRFTPDPDLNSSLNQDLFHVPSYLLNELVLKKLLRIDLEKKVDQAKIEYIKSHDETLKESGTKDAVCFWMRPLSFQTVLHLAKKGYVLPQKSTYFYPKVMTGFAFHSIESLEHL